MTTLVALTLVGTPALAGHNRANDVLEVLGQFGEIVDTINHGQRRHYRQRGKFVCVAKAPRNRGRDVRAKSVMPARVSRDQYGHRH